jgi:hypothetical protein
VLDSAAQEAIRKVEAEARQPRTETPTAVRSKICSLIVPGIVEWIVASLLR